MVTETHAAVSHVLRRTLDCIGLLFDYVYLTDGMDDDKDKDDKRRWMLVLVVRELGKGETLVSFSDIPHESTNKSVAKDFNRMVVLGYPEERAGALWFIMGLIVVIILRPL